MTYFITEMSITISEIPSKYGVNGAKMRETDGAMMAKRLVEQHTAPLAKADVVANAEEVVADTEVAATLADGVVGVKVASFVLYFMDFLSSLTLVELILQFAGRRRRPA